MVDITIVVLERAYASSVAVTLDMLNAAAHVAQRMGLPALTWRLVSPSGGAVSLSSGLTVPTQRMARQSRRDGSLWVVPGLGLESPPQLMARLAQPDAQAVIAALRWHGARANANAGTVAVAASCSAVFLLQAAGLLRGRRVTTSWWLAPTLQQQAPGSVVDADRMVVADGMVMTAGAALAQSDLMLQVLGRLRTPALATAVGQALVVDGRWAQSHYVAPALLAPGDALVAQLVQQIEAALPQVPSVAALASAVHRSTRTLARHVQRATGRSPLALVQAVRLQRARTLMEQGTLSVEAVAEQVGYQDATALRRLMRQSMGATPSQLRRRL